ncbi:MAG: LPS-assembly protein LptD [Henriciella sp.]|nr:LPS-assembly protein LptD [Henriciella sp.]MBO6694647.1 LPS-assembly protein LptD [Henriciella sp.]
MHKWTSFLLFAAALAQTGLANAQDTATPITVEQPKVVLDADNIFVSEADNTVIAEGNVEAKYEGRILRADRLIYFRDTDRVRAMGNVVVIDADGSESFANEIETSSNLVDGYAIGFSTRTPEGGVAVAESAVRSSEGYNALEKIVYTSCEVCDENDRPTWAIRARRAVLDDQTEMMSYRDAVLEIAGLPVLYLPYFAHPDPSSERRSGLLPPDFGSSSKLGVYYQQPYYWAISPYQDLTISPRIMANVNPLLEVQYRKRFWSGSVQADFSLTEEQEFDSDGEKFGEKELRGHIFAEGGFEIRPGWSWGFAIEQVSDDLYTRRYDIEGENSDRGLYAGQPRYLLNQLYTQAQAQDWYFDSSILTFETNRDNDSDARLPRALPLMFGEKLIDYGKYGTVALSGSTAILERELGVDSYRASGGVEWNANRVLPGGVLLNPFAESRFDYYQLDDTPSGVGEVSRGVATIGSRISYPLYRPGKVVDLIVEPEAMVAYGTSGANNPDIPIEDSLFYELDESSLFEANAASGFDTYEGGSKASLGTSITARWKNGMSISALGGRRWRDMSDPVFDVGSNLDGTTSDWVAGISADFGNPLRLETRVRLDDDDFKLNRIDARVNTNIWRFRGNARYYRIDGGVTSSGLNDEGIQVTADFKVTDNYYFLYGLSRDISGRVNSAGALSDPRDISQSIGLAYEDDCSRFEVSFERSEALDRTLGPTDSIKFRFALKTLGGLGSNDVD